MALLSKAFIALAGCRFCKKKKQPAICKSRVPQKEKEMLSARRLTEKCSAFSGDFAIVREEKCKKK